MEEADPTLQHKYVPWMAARYANGGIPRMEDLGRVEEYLDVFERLKTSGYFKRNPTISSDINRFKTLSHLGQFVMAVDQTNIPSNTEKSKAEEEEFYKTQQAVLLLNERRYKVVIPKSEAASCFFGRNTQWCTAAKKDNAFKNYGPLYIILDKPNNKRWQFCPSSGQYMDENDREIR